MILSVELPDSFAHRLRLDGAQGQRRALEIFAIDGYRSDELTRGQVGELLGLSFYETEEFLKKNQVETKLTMEEFQRGSAALEKLIAR
jgi:predicted HTH domain antitoxin